METSKPLHDALPEEAAEAGEGGFLAGNALHAQDLRCVATRLSDMLASPVRGNYV